jgi:hypothetical protein
MKLVTFGDSWPQGAEMPGSDDSKPTYGRLIAEKTNAEFYNYGLGGTSQEALVTQLEDFVANHYKANEKTIAIFFLTNPARSHYWPKNMSWNWESDERKHWPMDARNTIKELIVHFHDHDAYRSSLAISACQTWCKQLGIDDYYFAGWNRQTEWMPFVNTDKIWKAGNETAADWFGATKHNGEHLLDVQDNKYIKPNFAHPNELGHELIANQLYNWIYK